MQSKEIEEMVESCRKEFRQTLLEGRKPPPTGFVIFDLPEELDDVSIAVVTMSRQIYTSHDISELSKHVKNCTDLIAQAAGILVLMPPSVWPDMMGQSEIPAGVVGVLHVEYLDSCFKTWVLKPNGARTEEWKLHSTSHRTKFPMLLSDRCYTPALGKA